MRSFLTLQCTVLASVAVFSLPVAAQPSGPLLEGELGGKILMVGDAIPASLTGRPGNAARGRAIVANRQVGLCLLCHSGPIPEERLQGDLAPSLSGAGLRWTEGQLRMRIVDAGRLDPATIMPPYFRLGGLSRVASGFAGRTILTAEQIEDVVAYLVTLRE